MEIPLYERKKTLRNFIALEIYYDYVMDPLFSGLFQRKGSYLFYSVGNNGTILFVGTKRSRFILYSISTNTQWGG